MATSAHYLVLQYEPVPQASEAQTLVLRATVNLMNAIFQPALLTLGELDQAQHELRWSLHSAGAAFLLFRLFEMVATPFTIKGGIGYGAWQQAMPWTTSGYQKAQQALATAQEKGQLLLYNGGWLEDALINMAFSAWQQVKAQQSPMQRALTFPYERHEPLYVAESMLVVAWPDRDLNKIEALKRQCFTGAKSPYPTIDHTQHKASQWQEIATELAAVGLVIDQFFHRGYATTLAKMTQTTRQNIDYHLHAGQFARERNLSAALVWQLAREEGALA